jgi:tetratricopeptide (TPR) repeat protein
MRSCFELLRKIPAKIKVGFLMLLYASIIAEVPAQDLRDPKFMEGAQIGFTHIYNMDYEKAEHVFASLETNYPGHPAPPLYLASIFWLQELLRRQDLTLGRFVSPAYFSQKTDQAMPARERQEFFKNLQKAESRSNAILKINRRDKDGRYFLAMTYGMRASFAITVDHGYREAFSTGNKAYSLCRQLTEEDPNYADAYLTVGLYEYIVGSIPWYLKWLAFVVGAHGNKQEGLEHLRLAAEKGTYGKNEAQLIQTVLYVREHEYAEALQLSQSLATRFPRNFLFPLNVAQILQYSGHKDQATAALLQILKRVEAREPNFDRLPLLKFRYNLAVELMNMGKWDLAQEQFRKSAENPQTPVRERSLSHLRLGRMLEAKGQVSEAIREYKQVLALEDVEDSHDQAKRALKKAGAKGQ